jgi:hypothetical protein
MINKLSKLAMLGWTILCFVGSCSGIMNVSQQTHGRELAGAEALGVGFGVFFWIILWAVPTVVLGVIALVTRPTTTLVEAAPSFDALRCPGCGRPSSIDGSFCAGCGVHFTAATFPSANLLQPSQTTAVRPRWCGRTSGVVVVFAAIGVVVILFSAPHSNSHMSSNDTAPIVENSKVISAQELYNAYHANEVAADDLYKDQALEVSGRVAGINRDFTHSIYVELATANEFENVRAELSEGQQGTASTLFKGISITVVCRGNGMVIGSPTLKDCSIRQ